MSTPSDFRIISTLLGDALTQFSKLFQNELDLARAEFSEKTQHLSAAIGFIVAGAVLMIPALVMALLALSAALVSAGWSEPLSYLISAIGAAVLAALLFAIGKSMLISRKLTPRETIRQLEKDKDTLKGMVQ